MNKLEQAITVLARIRTQLGNDLANQVLASRAEMMLSTRAGDDPVAADPVMDRLSRGLTNVNRAIANLRSACGKPVVPDRSAGPSNRPSEKDGVFSAFQRLVAADQLEKAARELSRLIRLSGDCAFTATRYYARTVQSKPSIVTRVNAMCENVETATVSKCMKTLVAAFGLQAVESMTAIQALREARRASLSPISRDGRRATVASGRA